MNGTISPAVDTGTNAPVDRRRRSSACGGDHTARARPKQPAVRLIANKIDLVDNVTTTRRAAGRRRGTANDANAPIPGSGSVFAVPVIVPCRRSINGTGETAPAPEGGASRCRRAVIAIITITDALSAVARCPPPSLIVSNNGIIPSGTSAIGARLFTPDDTMTRPSDANAIMTHRRDINDGTRSISPLTSATAAGRPCGVRRRANFRRRRNLSFSDTGFCCPSDCGHDPAERAPSLTGSDVHVGGILIGTIAASTLRDAADDIARCIGAA